MSGEPKKIRITFEYNNARFTDVVEPYRKLSYAKQIAKNYFFPLKGDTRMFYQNKDITNCNNMLLGELFNHKEKAYIKLIPLTKRIDTEVKRSNNKLSIDDIALSNPKKEQQRKALLRKSANASPLQATPLIKCACNSVSNCKVTYYCRHCNEFICSTCRNDDTHSIHPVINIDLRNLNESAKLYAITVQSELVFHNRKIKEDYMNYQKANFIDASVRYEQLLQKLRAIQEMYTEMNEIVTLTNEKMNMLQSVIKSYESNAKEVNTELEQILIDIYNIQKVQGKQMKFEEFKNICEMIHLKEKGIVEHCKDAVSYSIGYELTKKIDMMYNKLDKVIDEVHNWKVPLKLDVYTYENFTIVKECKEKGDNDEFNHDDTNTDNNNINDDNNSNDDNGDEEEGNDDDDNDNDDINNQDEDDEKKQLPPIKEKGKQIPQKEQEFVEQVTENDKKQQQQQQPNNTDDVVAFDDIVNNDENNNEIQNDYYVDLNNKFHNVYGK